MVFAKRGPKRCGWLTLYNFCPFFPLDPPRAKESMGLRQAANFILYANLLIRTHQMSPHPSSQNGLPPGHSCLSCLSWGGCAAVHLPQRQLLVLRGEALGLLRPLGLFALGLGLCLLEHRAATDDHLEREKLWRAWSVYVIGWVKNAWWPSKYPM